MKIIRLEIVRQVFFLLFAFFLTAKRLTLIQPIFAHQIKVDFFAHVFSSCARNVHRKMATKITPKMHIFGSLLFVVFFVGLNMIMMSEIRL